MRGIDRFLGRSETRSPHPSGFAMSDFLEWVVGGNYYNALGLPSTLLGRQERIAGNFGGLIGGALKSDSVVFAVERARLSVFTEARFQWQRMDAGRPGDLWGNPDLAVLEKPWQGGTTGDLLARMLLDADFAGNGYYTRSALTGGRIRRLRPDRVSIILGSQSDADRPEDALDCEVVGYAYDRGEGRGSVFLPADEVAHFAPMPDPEANYRGMSWLTAVLREIEGDKAATEHKLKFFENGATPNIIMKMDPALTAKQVEEFADLFAKSNEGVRNAYKTLFAGGGADPMVVGANLQQLDFKATQGAGETRIAAAGGVPAVIVGISEGLAGSSLNAGNFASARRQFGDGTIRPLWRNAAGSLETICRPPSGSRLWYDARDVAFLREDEKDAAEIEQIKASTIRQLVDGGFDPLSVVAAVQAQNMTLLEHTGKLSVQLQEPGAEPDPPARSTVRRVERDDDGVIVRLVDEEIA